MTSKNDSDLLGEFIRDESQDAFTALVHRHLDLVHCAALRQVRLPQLAEEVAQSVFTDLARNAARLKPDTMLTAWLYQVTRRTAIDVVRGEARRQFREQIALELNVMNANADNWTQIEPLLDEAMHALDSSDRTAILLRFFENKSLREVGQTLGTTDDTARKRVNRAIEHLREFFAKRGVTVGASGLVVVISANAVHAAPVGLAVTISKAVALIGTTLATGTKTTAAASTPSILTTMSTTKASFITAALVTAVCISVGYHIRWDKEPLSVTAAGSRAEAVTQLKEPPGFVGSALFVLWRQLHDTYGTTAGAMPDLYHAIADIEDPFRRRALRAMLIAEWVQVDPENGLAFFLGKNGDASQRRQFLEEWLARDAPAAVDALMVSPSGWEGMARDSLTEIARCVPARVADIVARLPKSDTDTYHATNVRDAFAILAESGLASARAAAEALTGPNRDQALAGVAKAWARSDLKAAIAWAKTLPDGTDRDEVIRAALMGQSATDPAAALELAGLVPAGGKPDSTGWTTGARVLEEAAKADFDATVAWLTCHPGRLGDSDMRGLESALTERLNEGAAGFLTKHTAAGTLSTLLPGIESALVNSASGQRAAVWEWLKTQPDNETTNALKKKVLQSAAYQDPELALRLAIEVPRNPEGDFQLEMLANNFFNGGEFLYRFDHLISHAPDRLKKPLAESAFNILNPDTMGDPHLWIDRLPLLSEASRTRGIRSIATAWAEQTPEGAIDWVASLPAGEARSEAVAGITFTWAAKDSESASAWVASMPAGAERDRSAHSLVVAIAEKFPREAWEWAVSITDAERRVTAATQAAKMMARQDLSTAQQWIESGPFTPEMRATLQSAFGPATPSSGTQ
jgi:RNA polymerase sigma factor (sigma-70 family)